MFSGWWGGPETPAEETKKEDARENEIVEETK